MRSTVKLSKTNKQLGREIEERKQAEEALNQQQAEQQIILDSVPAMIFYKDKEDRFIRVNEALAKAFNLSKEEIIGRTAAELSPTQEKEYISNALQSSQRAADLVRQLQTLSTGAVTKKVSAEDLKVGRDWGWRWCITLLPGGTGDI